MRLARALFALAAAVMTCTAGTGLARAEKTAPPVEDPVQRHVTLRADDGRAVDVTIYAPANGCRACTLVIFSHGALSTPQRYDVLLAGWARRGFVIAAPLHTDSEEHANKDRYPDSRATRIGDWIAVEKAMRGHPLKGISLNGHVIAAGHSYGALIAEVAGGARLSRGDLPVAQWRRPDAVIALSPPGTLQDLVTREGFAGIAVPTLVVTGTTDILPGFIDHWQSHLDSFEALAPGHGFALIFTGMDHYFNGAFCRPTREGVAASAAQIARLNDAVTGFVDKALTGRLPDAAQWSEQSDAMVSARAK